MCGNNGKAYKDTYVDNRLNIESHIHRLLQNLKLSNYFISTSIEKLHHSMLLNNEYDIMLHLDILIDESRDSMFLAYEISNSLSKGNPSGNQITDILYLVDGIKLGYAALVALANKLKQHLDNKDNDNIDYTLALIYETYNQILEYIETLKYI